MNKLQMPFNLERIIDDFAFFCFFIGNDFLPSLTTLDISEGALDHLIDFYKSCLPHMQDYITDQGVIHWDRAKQFIDLLAKQEHETFINRIKQIGEKREQIISFDTNFNSTVTTKDKATLMKMRLREKR